MFNKLFFCVIIVLFLVGCSSEELKQLNQANKELNTVKKIYSDKESSQNIFDKIEVGISMDEVKQIAGEPLRKQQMESTYGKTELWYYEGKIQVMFSDGYVEHKAKY